MRLHEKVLSQNWFIVKLIVEIFDFEQANYRNSIYLLVLKLLFRVQQTNWKDKIYLLSVYDSMKKDLKIDLN